jgi:Flp pilus assembly pilin Flp
MVSRLAVGLAYLFRDDRGQDLVEYALLSAAIGFAGIVTFEWLAAGIGAVYQQWGTNNNALWESPPASGS